MAKKQIENNESQIGEYVRETESAFIDGGGTLTSKYVTSDFYEDISKIYAYLESKHTSGDVDSLGRDKPFFNIVLAARNVWFRATDIDRKNIEVKPTKSTQVMAALLATVHLQNWMRKENYGAFLNDWGIDLAGFNSAVSKFVEVEGELHCMNVPWNRLIVDQVNFKDNPKIEVLEVTEAQLYQRKGYDADMVKKLCDALEARQTLDKQDKDQKSNYIKLYEVHGVFPLSYLTGKEKDQDEFVQQMHVVSFVASKQEGKFDDFTIYSGREEKDPYMLTSLLPATDGSVSLMGSVKSLFEAQWMMNHTVKNIKDSLDIASRLLFQTSDENFIGRNVLSAIESGDILIHKANQPLTKVNNDAPNITAQESFGNLWKGLSNEITGISESMLGNTAPSGTAWRQVEALLQESHSLFELMTENKALSIEQMLRVYVIPFLKKKMDSSEEVSVTLEAHNITKFDSVFVPGQAIKQYNERASESVLSGELTQAFDRRDEEMAVKESLAPQGNQRFFKPEQITWKEVVKDLEWDLEINISGEAVDIQKVMTTLNTALTVVMNPAYATNPQAQMIVGKILSASGVISPLELSAIPPPEPQPLPAQVGAGGNSGGQLPLTE